MSPRIAVFAVVTVALFSGGIAFATPALAHCPGTGPASQYVYGGNDTNWVVAARVEIGHVLAPDVCTSGVSHSVSLVYGSGSSKAWLQVGWRYYDGYAEPKGYCERKPTPATGNSYVLTEYSIPNQAQFYAYDFNSGTGKFECKIAGTLRRLTDPSWIGFSSSKWVPVQAEAHEDHLQLGRIDPNWLSFQSTGYRPVGTTGWTTMAIQGVSSDDPVWNFTKPSSSHMKVNTDASH